MALRKDTPEHGEENLHKNHRKRVFERYEKTGFDSFPEHNILEMLLFYSIPRADTNPTAHRLIQRFGSLYGVLTAPAEEMTEVRGVGPASALMLHSVMDGARNANLRRLTAKPITAFEHLYMLAVEWFTGKPSGTVAIALFTETNRCLDIRGISSEHRITPCVNTDEIIALAKELGAVKIVFMHNHSGGTMAPSENDRYLTLRIHEALSAAGIRLAEHLIVNEFDVIAVLDDALGEAASAFPRN